MTTADEIELAAWRLAFDHIADGTPDGVAKAINAEMDRLARELDHCKEIAALKQRVSNRLAIDWTGLAQIGRDDVHS